MSMTEAQLRQKVADIINSWINNSGKGSPQHLDILSTYNNHTPLAYGYRVQVYDAYCATTVSAAFIRAGIAQYTGTECSCPRFVEIAKSKGYWTENDAYVPKVGDAVLYDWEDFGYGDNLGVPDHIGIVTAVGSNTFVVTEGNMGGGCVGKRTMSINGRYIRGFITPNYADIAAKLGNAAPAYMSSAETAAVEKEVYNFLRSNMKLNVAAACGVIANIKNESGFNYLAVGDNGASYGLCQWHDSRFDGLKSWCKTHGYDYQTVQGQLQFLKNELNGVCKGTLTTLQKVENTADGAYTAGQKWCSTYEIPANVSVVSEARGKLAKETYWPKYNGTPADYVHTIVFGDTLSAIAQKAGTTYQTLAKWNGIANPNFVPLGTKIYLTEATAAVAKLAKLGVINSPDHWLNAVANQEPMYIDKLFIKAANKISKVGERTSTVDEGLEALVKAEVIDSPGYWKENLENNVDHLICALGGAVK